MVQADKIKEENGEITEANKSYFKNQWEIIIPDAQTRNTTSDTIRVGVVSLFQGTKNLKIIFAHI